MKVIKSTIDPKILQKELLIEINSSSAYCLVENGLTSEDNLINIYFDPTNLSSTKELLIKSGYYYKDKAHFLGKSNDEYCLVKLEDIIYIEGINNDTYIHTQHNEYLVKEKLYELELLLFDQKFIRVSKSFIVSINHIIKIKPTFNGKLILLLSNKSQLEVNRHYLSKFKNYIGI